MLESLDEDGSFPQKNEDGSNTVSVIARDGWRFVKWHITIKYVQVQRKPDVAARTTTVVHYGRIPPVPPSEYSPEGQPEWLDDVYGAYIEVFPAVFERGEYLIPSEVNSDEPWARDPQDAIKMVLLHELGHVEAYITNNKRLVTYPSVEDSEKGADSFAATVARCTPVE